MWKCEVASHDKVSFPYLHIKHHLQAEVEHMWVSEEGVTRASDCYMGCVGSYEFVRERMGVYSPAVYNAE